MSALTDDDRAVLRREGCSVDADAVAEALYGAHLAAHATVGYRDQSLRRGWGNLNGAERAHWQQQATPALRAAGLDPGEPSVGLLLAAIEERGWDAMLYRVADEWCGEVQAEPEPRAPLPYGYAADPATALALAFCRAVRAAEGGAADGDD